MAAPRKLCFWQQQHQKSTKQLATHHCLYYLLKRQYGQSGPRTVHSSQKRRAFLSLVAYTTTKRVFRLSYSFSLCVLGDIFNRTNSTRSARAKRSTLSNVSSSACHPYARPRSCSGRHSSQKRPNVVLGTVVHWFPIINMTKNVTSGRAQVPSHSLRVHLHVKREQP